MAFEIMRHYCRGCDSPGAKKTFGGSTNMREGWWMVADQQRDLEYHQFCTDCAAKLARLVSEIYALTGIRHLYFAGLVEKAQQAAPPAAS